MFLRYNLVVGAWGEADNPSVPETKTLFWWLGCVRWCRQDARRSPAETRTHAEEPMIDGIIHTCTYLSTLLFTGIFYVALMHRIIWYTYDIQSVYMFQSDLNRVSSDIELSLVYPSELKKYPPFVKALQHACTTFNFTVAVVWYVRSISNCCWHHNLADVFIKL